ncbi:MAG: tetratricopeptide repeat protein [Candidatus Thorarchaeota archaeon]|nr:tetratricopeptide repeat protein [Candidatus Thorarchaeota archaeon]
MTGPIIPEFSMYEGQLDRYELEDLDRRTRQTAKGQKDRFRDFTDILLEYVGSGEWQKRSTGFVVMCAKASYLRGMYGYNQALAKGSTSQVAKAFASAAYCRQSLDPRWLSRLRNHVNSLWQSKDYIGFAETSGQLASVLIDLGYTDQAREVANDSITRATEATVHNVDLRNRVQAVLLDARITLAHIAGTTKSIEEALIRLDAAEEAARHFDNSLALANIQYCRAYVLMDSHEYEEAEVLIGSALKKFEMMGYLQGVANARNIRGLMLLRNGQFQDARDQFEETLLIQQQLSNQIGVARTLINVGEIDRRLGQLEQMEVYNKRALEISHEAEYMRGMAVAMLNLGDIAVRRGDLDSAKRYYEDAHTITERSGMKEEQCLALSQLADLAYMRREFERSVDLATQATRTAQEISYPLYVFHGLVTTLIAEWEMDLPPDRTSQSAVRAIMDSNGEWADENALELMRGVRRQVFEDPSLESSTCILYDSDKNFECRADRTSAGKECFGNLLWTGSLCPYFRRFLSKLRGEADPT